MGVFRDIINRFFKKSNRITPNSDEQTKLKNKFDKNHWEFKYDINVIFTFLVFVLIIMILNILIYLFYRIWG